MEVYYTPNGNIRPPDLEIAGEEAHHLRDVMRRKPGEEILVADGEGVMYRVRIESLERGAVRCLVLERLPGFNEPEREVTLVQALLKQPARMEWIIEKATELGVRRIIPLAAERCLVARAREERWRHIAVSAMKQCVRCRAPEIAGALDLAGALRAVAGGDRLLFHESAGGEWLPARDAGAGPISLFIGPEGGFSPGEVHLARVHGAAVLPLGRRRLRSETAAIAALSRILVD